MLRLAHTLRRLYAAFFCAVGLRLRAVGGDELRGHICQKGFGAFDQESPTPGLIVSRIVVCPRAEEFALPRE